MENSQENKLIITASHPDIIIPTTAYNNDSGYDLYSPIDVILESNKPVKINMGIKIIPNPNEYLQIENRSSVGMKGIVILTKIIDNGYRGEIYLNLVNISKEPYVIKKDDKIAQFIIKKLIKHEIQVVESDEFDKINKNLTERKDNKFGSSNNKSFVRFLHYFKK